MHARFSSSVAWISRPPTKPAPRVSFDSLIQCARVPHPTRGGVPSGVRQGGLEPAPVAELGRDRAAHGRSCDGRAEGGESARRQGRFRARRGGSRATPARRTGVSSPFRRHERERGTAVDACRNGGLEELDLLPIRELGPDHDTGHDGVVGRHQEPLALDFGIRPLSREAARDELEGGHEDPPPPRPRRLRTARFWPEDRRGDETRARPRPACRETARPAATRGSNGGSARRLARRAPRRPSNRPRSSPICFAISSWMAVAAARSGGSNAPENRSIRRFSRHAPASSPPAVRMFPSFIDAPPLPGPCHSRPPVAGSGGRGGRNLLPRGGPIPPQMIPGSHISDGSHSAICGKAMIKAEDDSCQADVWKRASEYSR